VLKQWVLAVAAVAVLIVFTVSLVPFFVNAEAFRPTIESELSSALGREVTMGHVTFAILAGSLDAEDIFIADDPEFSSIPFIQAKKLNVGVEVLQIVFHHRLHITRLNIDTPSIQLIQNATGKWNFSTIGSTSAKPGETQQSSSVPDFKVQELKITNGSATLSSIPITRKVFQYTDVNLTVKNFSFLKSSPFELSAKLPGDSTIKLSGNAGPIPQKNTMRTPFEATLQLKNFDPVASGLIEKNKGIAMQGEVDAQLKSDGVDISSTGKINASQLQLAPRGLPAKEPVNIDFVASRNIETKKGTISDVAIHAGSVEVHVNGSVQSTQQQGMMLDLHVTEPSLPIDQLARLLPAVGIHLPTGSALEGGTLTANITVTGPATTPTLAGSVEIDNTKLAGFDLGSKIQGLDPMRGTSDGTRIQVLKANLNSSPQGTKITDINANLPQLGSATGEGTIADSGEINFSLNAKLNPSNSSANAKPASNRVVPLTITGTAASPSIKANAGALR
jgi:AsmA protein